MRSKPLYGLLAFLAAGSASFFLLRPPSPSFASSSPADTPAKQPVIVELFTSEGCSTCPPADSLLKKLSEDQPFDGIEILALEEHVDYWNNQGWIDPFSSVDFSVRQQQYTVTLPDGGVYTPQMIIDGRAQLVGNNTVLARQQIRWAAAHPKARLQLTSVPANKQNTRTFELSVDPSSAALNASRLDLWVAITEKGLQSHVTAGENSGESLQHAPVVRLLHKQQPVSLPLSNPVTFSVNLHKNWNPSNLTAVVFLADPKSHQIQAAGSLPL